MITDEKSHSYSFDELHSYLANFKSDAADFEEGLTQPQDYFEMVSLTAENLRGHIYEVTTALSHTRLKPVDDNTKWTFDNNYSISDQDGVNRVLFSQRNDGDYLVTFRIETPKGTMNLTLTDPYRFDFELSELLNNKEAVDHLVYKLKEQVSTSMLLLSQMTQLLNDHINPEITVGQNAHAFVSAYYNLIRPHLVETVGF